MAIAFGPPCPATFGPRRRPGCPSNGVRILDPEGDGTIAHPPRPRQRGPSARHPVARGPASSSYVGNQGARYLRTQCAAAVTVIELTRERYAARDGFCGPRCLGDRDGSRRARAERRLVVCRARSSGSRGRGDAPAADEVVGGEAAAKACRSCASPPSSPPGERRRGCRRRPSPPAARPPPPASARAAWKMSGCGFDRSASSEDVSSSIQVVDPRDPLVSLELVPLGRGGERDPLAVAADPPEELAVAAGTCGLWGMVLRRKSSATLLCSISSLDPLDHLRGQRRRGINWSPPLPICCLTSSNGTSAAVTGQRWEPPRLGAWSVDRVDQRPVDVE